MCATFPFRHSQTHPSFKIQAFSHARQYVCVFCNWLGGEKNQTGYVILLILVWTIFQFVNIFRIFIYFIFNHGHLFLKAKQKS